MLLNLETGEQLADHVIPAYRFMQRLKGLMFKKHLPHKQAMHIQPCTSIHTYFMKFTIDVVYLDADQRIVAIDESLPPRKIGTWHKKTDSVIEFSAGTIANSQTKVGHKLYVYSQYKK